MNIPISREQRIEQLIKQSFVDAIFWLDNESSQHSVPVGSETHFKLVLVTDEFTGITRVARQRLVHKLLEQEFASGLHALSLQLFTTEEWQKAEQQSRHSPRCMGGKKGESQ